MVMLRRRETGGPVIIEEGPTVQGRVVWRTWRLVPEDGPARNARPLLTGLSGFPWRGPGVDARCMRGDASRVAGPPFWTSLDRHHRVVPEPECTCGIYASRHDLGDPPAWLRRSRDPLVSGFVALTGRLVADGDDYRAQRGHIVGPLTLVPPRTSPLGGAARWITAVDGRYRAHRMAVRAGVPYDEWRSAVHHELAARYGVPVVGEAKIAEGARWRMT